MFSRSQITEHGNKVVIAVNRSPSSGTNKEETDTHGGLQVFVISEYTHLPPYKKCTSEK